MLQSFIIVLREGFESFLLVAIIAAYLERTGRKALLPAVYWGVLFSIFSSALFGWIILITANGPLWEGIMGVISAVFVTWFVVHMWKTAPHLKSDLEHSLAQKTGASVGRAAFWGVFAFTAFMITREGMETALLLIQVHSAQVVSGAFLGLLAAGAFAVLWKKLGHLINLKLFFQVTAIFLLLFVVQILIYSFHEFTEAGIFPNSEALHLATEPYAPDGLYGKWISLLMVGICVAWVLFAGARDFYLKGKTARNSS